MRSRPDSLEPWWAPGTGAGFRQRCASALTHPATVVALATLLLNDLLFKAMWPDAWVTGKLSDLAWVALALPLLAFLLSLLTRGSVIAARAAFLTAYVGLPLLYAAFNTFEPVHYWILRGISIASGGMGQTPLDATDSIVIPLGWAVAVWVWRRPVLSPDALRLRWGLLVAGVAVLASIASSPLSVDIGIQNIGISEDGAVHAGASFFEYSNYRTYQSDDGGLSWTEGRTPTSSDSVAWGGNSAETPRGNYSIEGREVVLAGDDGSTEMVYSTWYLSKPANLWTQAEQTMHLGARAQETQPRAIIYDERSGNLIVALGIQGILVGTPDGQWTPHAVGPYTPTDFSFLGKTRLLLSNLGFWATALALSLSMTGASLILSQQSRGIGWVLLCAVLGSLGIVLLSLGVEFLGLGIVIPLITALILTLVTAYSIWGRNSRALWTLASAIAILSLLASGALLIMFGGQDTQGIDPIYGLRLFVVAAVALTLGVASLLISLRLRYWRATISSLVGMNVLVILAFMLWLHLGIALVLAKAAVFALTGVVAFLLFSYAKRRTS